MKIKSFLLVALVISVFLGVVGCNTGGMETKTWMGQTLQVEAIQSIKLNDLTGELVKEYGQEEFAELANSLNQAKTDDSAYIEMIAGYIMTISLTDGEIRLTSYGSETNLVATITKGEEVKTLHLICPELAKILITNLETASPGKELNIPEA